MKEKNRKSKGSSCALARAAALDPCILSIFISSSSGTYGCMGHAGSAQALNL
jgi:hypothetical protein